MPNPKASDDGLRQEVLELTSLLRDAPSWADLRASLQAKHLSPTDILLASFCEDEGSNQYGLLLTRERQFIEFSRNTSSTGFNVWRPRLIDESLHRDYFTIEQALQILASKF